jgi:alkaline phosphatase D
MLDRQRRFVWPDPADSEHYLGAEQTDWLLGQIEQNRAQWMVLGQGTRFGSTAADGEGGASWDFESRHEVLQACAAAGVENLVVLTGDIHKAGALDVVEDPQGAYDPDTGAGASGVELYCNSISSPGSSDNTDEAPQYHWSEGLYRGYLVVDFTEARMVADFYGFFDLGKTLEERPVDTWLKGFQTAAGSHHLTQTAAAVDTRSDRPALAP